jgi:hypothetical protein
MDSHPIWKKILRTRLTEREVLDGSLQAAIRIATDGGHFSQGDLLILRMIDGPDFPQPLADRVVENWLEKVVRIRIPDGRLEGKFLRFHTVVNYLNSIRTESTRAEVEEAVVMYRLLQNNLHRFTDLNVEILKEVKMHRSFDLMWDLRMAFRRKDPDYVEKKKTLNADYYQENLTTPEGKKLKSERNRIAYANRKARKLSQ